MKTFLSFITLALFLSGASCQKETNSQVEKKMIDLDEKSAALIEADNDFGLELFQKVRENSREENIMISPLSISVALAMAYNGADGNTKTEMEKTLRLNGLTPQEINASYQMLIGALQSLDQKVVFELANAIFYAQGFSVKPDFLKVNENHYDAEVSPLDFSSAGAVKAINTWVAQKTHDKIRSIINKLNPQDRMILLNAIYFNGIWTNEFDENGTKELNFNKLDGSNMQVAMMGKEDSLEYTANLLFRAIKLPYGNGQYNMVVMLPENHKNSLDIIAALTPSNWHKWNGEFVFESQVVVSMPRFKFEFETGLNDILKGMGMLQAFVPGKANFTKITDNEDLYISSVIHKSFIDVNENGTEAAAVTAITFSTTSIMPQPVEKIYFTVDRPFVFAITEKDTGAILFIGEVQNPKYVE